MKVSASTRPGNNVGWSHLGEEDLEPGPLRTEFERKDLPIKAIIYVLDDKSQLKYERVTPR